MKEYYRKADVFQAIAFDVSDIDSTVDFLGGSAHYLVVKCCKDGNTYQVEHRGEVEFNICDGQILQRAPDGDINWCEADGVAGWVEVKS